MKKQTLKYLISVMLVTVFSMTAMAQSDQLSSKMSDLLFEGYSQDFIENLNRLQLEQDVVYKLSGTPVSDACVAMMNKDYVKGPIGQSVAKAFVDNANRLPLLVEGGSVNKYCRKYSKMTDKEKAQVWVLILTAIAHFESSCKPAASAKGPNGIAYGYYQLHKGQEHRYDGQRGFCNKGDAGKPLQASRCTLGMLETQFDRRAGELFSNQSYWEVLRPRGRAQKAGIIRKTLERSQICNTKAI